MDGRVGLHLVRDDGEVVKLPPGFRFEPTEEEIVFQYLQRKIFSLPLPASVIPEFPNICTYDPWDLPGDIEQDDRYFFSNKEATNGSCRVSCNGYWKATSKAEKHIICPDVNKSSSTTPMIFGMKKTLMFYYGKPPYGSKTNWIMHQYRLVARNNSQGSLMQQIGNLVICHVFQNKRVNGGKAEEESGDNININHHEKNQIFGCYNFMMRHGLGSSYGDDNGDSCDSSSSSSRALNDEVSSSYSSGTFGYDNHQ